ncbi:MAG: 2Fe-2S iron-sulfur cluster-binding protein, partial [Eubacteriales bacterium]|nr:2Fe-2S iron-sulfur cluster-binding protein [Eubacteriales bacterium]
MYKTLNMTVNGSEVSIPVDERESLLDALRNRLGLTSVKKGC